METLIRSSRRSQDPSKLLVSSRKRRKFCRDPVCGYREYYGQSVKEPHWALPRDSKLAKPHTVGRSASKCRRYITSYRRYSHKALNISGTSKRRSLGGAWMDVAPDRWNPWQTLPFASTDRFFHPYRSYSANADPSQDPLATYETLLKKSGKDGSIANIQVRDNSSAKAVSELKSRADFTSLLESSCVYRDEESNSWAFRLCDSFGRLTIQTGFDTEEAAKASFNAHEEFFLSSSLLKKIREKDAVAMEKFIGPNPLTSSTKRLIKLDTSAELSDELLISEASNAGKLLTPSQLRQQYVSLNKDKPEVADDEAGFMKWCTEENIRLTKHARSLWIENNAIPEATAAALAARMRQCADDSLSLSFSVLSSFYNRYISTVSGSQDRLREILRLLLFTSPGSYRDFLRVQGLYDDKESYLSFIDSKNRADCFFFGHAPYRRFPSESFIVMNTFLNENELAKDLGFSDQQIAKGDAVRENHRMIEENIVLLFQHIVAAIAYDSPVPDPRTIDNYDVLPLPVERAAHDELFDHGQGQGYFDNSIVVGPLDKLKALKGEVAIILDVEPSCKLTSHKLPLDEDLNLNMKFGGKELSDSQRSNLNEFFHAKSRSINSGPGWLLSKKNPNRLKLNENPVGSCIINSGDSREFWRDLFWGRRRGIDHISADSHAALQKFIDALHEHYPYVLRGMIIKSLGLFVSSVFRATSCPRSHVKLRKQLMKTSHHLIHLFGERAPEMMSLLNDFVRLREFWYAGSTALLHHELEILQACVSPDSIPIKTPTKSVPPYEISSTYNEERCSYESSGRLTRHSLLFDADDRFVDSSYSSAIPESQKVWSTDEECTIPETLVHLPPFLQKTSVSHLSMYRWCGMDGRWYKAIEDAWRTWYTPDIIGDFSTSIEKQADAIRAFRTANDSAFGDFAKLLRLHQSVKPEPMSNLIHSCSEIVQTLDDVSRRKVVDAMGSFWKPGSSFALPHIRRADMALSLGELELALLDALGNAEFHVLLPSLMQTLNIFSPEVLSGVDRILRPLGTVSTNLDRSVALLVEARDDSESFNEGNDFKRFTVFNDRPSKSGGGSFSLDDGVDLDFPRPPNKSKSSREHFGRHGRGFQSTSEEEAKTVFFSNIPSTVTKEEFSKLIESRFGEVSNIEFLRYSPESSEQSVETSPDKADPVQPALNLIDENYVTEGSYVNQLLPGMSDLEGHVNVNSMMMRRIGRLIDSVEHYINRGENVTQRAQMDFVYFDEVSEESMKRKGSQDDDDPQYWSQAKLSKEFLQTQNEIKRSKAADAAFVYRLSSIQVRVGRMTERILRDSRTASLLAAKHLSLRAKQLAYFSNLLYEYERRLAIIENSAVSGSTGSLADVTADDSSDYEVTDLGFLDIENSPNESVIDMFRDLDSISPLDTESTEESTAVIFNEIMQNAGLVKSHRRGGPMKKMDSFEEHDLPTPSHCLVTFASVDTAEQVLSPILRAFGMTLGIRNNTKLVERFSLSDAEKRNQRFFPEGSAINGGNRESHLSEEVNKLIGHERIPIDYSRIFRKVDSATVKVSPASIHRGFFVGNFPHSFTTVDALRELQALLQPEFPGIELSSKTAGKGIFGRDLYIDFGSHERALAAFELVRQSEVKGAPLTVAWVKLGPRFSGPRKTVSINIT